MTYDQQKREAIANAKHLVELLEEISNEHPGTTKLDRRDLMRALAEINGARHDVLKMICREASQ